MKRYIVTIISLSFVLSLNIYFRLFPVDFPQFKSRAKAIAKQKFYQDISKKIDNAYPELDVLTKNKLKKTKTDACIAKNKKIFTQGVQEEYNKLKDEYQDEKGQTYLMELDCWHWARYTENVYRLGHPGDKVVNGKQMDSLMLAPSGSYIPWNTFLFHASSWLYKIFSLINKDISLFTFLFYLPLFFVTIFIIFLYLFCFAHWGNLSAIVSCLYVGLAPVFLFRSSAGWFDTDTLNLLLPLAIVWAYLSAYKYASLKSRFFWICLAAFLSGIFCFTWGNWWFILLVIILYETFSLLNFSSSKSHISTLAYFLILGFFWIIVFSGVAPITNLFNQIKGAFLLNNPINEFIWPNVFSTVAELKKPAYEDIIDCIGGVPLFISGLACLLLLLYRHLRKQKCTVFEREFRLLLSVWFFAMSFACLKGLRFAMFIVIPLGVSLGWILNEAYEYFEKIKKPAAAIILAIAFLLFSESLNSAFKKATQIFPLMDDAYYKVLTAIDKQTPQNAIINSWWDFGDWFKVVAKRRVIFDGQSQNVPQSYWMARVFLTDSEQEAINILRMLNNGGNSAFEIINKQLKDPYKSVLLLKKTLALDPRKIETALNESLPKQTAEEVAKLISAKPQGAYFIVDYPMLKKISPISFIDNWDFIKLYIANNINKKTRGKVIGYIKGLLADDKKKAERLYIETRLVPKGNLHNWVSRRFKFYGGIAEGQRKNDSILFDNGLVYNPKEQAAFLYSPEERKYKTPISLFVPENSALKKFAYQAPDLDFSVLILKQGENYKTISLNPSFAQSLFVRLYFLRGAGLKHFKPFIEEEARDGYIRVFEIIWD